jgi:hypothetical protein
MPMKQIKPEDPTPVTVSNTIPAGTAGNSAAKAATVSVVSIAIGTDGGTANAGMVSWINPESSTILVTNAFLRWTTTGTGTFDMGVSDDGTGASDNMINGGTMNTAVAGVLMAIKTNVAGSAGTIGVAQGYVLGPGGTGANNSIVAKTSETASTARGSVVITYLPLLD